MSDDLEMLRKREELNRRRRKNKVTGAYTPIRKRETRPGRPRLRPAVHPTADGFGFLLNDRIVQEFYRYTLDERIEEELQALEGARGPRGISVRTLLVGLMLAQFQHRSTQIAVAWKVLYLQLRPGSRRLLNIPAWHDDGIERERNLEPLPDDKNALKQEAGIHRRRYNASKQVYRAWAKLVDKFDPHPHDRRRRLSLQEAEEATKAWSEPGNEHFAQALEELADCLIHAPLKTEAASRALRRWPGDVGLDDTPIVPFSKPAWPSQNRASLDFMAGLYYKGGARPRASFRRQRAHSNRHNQKRQWKRRDGTPGDGAKEVEKKPIFAYGSMLTFGGHAKGDLAGHYPAGICYGMSLRSPGREPGPAAIRAIKVAYDVGLISGRVCVDRGISQAMEEKLHIPLLEMGLKIVRHYKDFEIDVQDSFKGAVLISGQLYCPCMPDILKTAGQQLIDAKTPEEHELAMKHFKAREPYKLKLKENVPNGDKRYMCPAGCKHPTCVCHRKPAKPQTPRVVDLDMPKVRSAVTLPATQRPQDDTDSWPAVCTEGSITVPASFGARWRQEYDLFSGPWQEAWSGLRSQNEGGNGHLKREDDDSLNKPGLRRSPGIIAQTILVAVILCVSNFRKIHRAARVLSLMGDDRGVEPMSSPTVQPDNELADVPVSQLTWQDPELEDPQIE